MKIINIILLLVDNRGGVAPCGWDSREAVADLSASPQPRLEPSSPSRWDRARGASTLKITLPLKRRVSL